MVNGALVSTRAVLDTLVAALRVLDPEEFAATLPSAAEALANPRHAADADQRQCEKALRALVAAVVHWYVTCPSPVQSVVDALYHATEHVDQLDEQQKPEPPVPAVRRPRPSGNARGGSRRKVEVTR